MATWESTAQSSTFNADSYIDKASNARKYSFNSGAFFGVDGGESFSFDLFQGIKKTGYDVVGINASKIKSELIPAFETYIKGVNGKIDKKALLAAAYEEMNGVKEMSVEDFSETYLMNEDMTVEPLDVNKDGKIDIAEYGANMLAADLLSKGTTDVNKVDGSMNTKGMNAIVAYSKKANAQAASELYSNIYNTYELGSVLDELDLD